MADKGQNKGDKHWNYNIKQCSKSGAVDIINYMSEYVMLVQ